MSTLLSAAQVAAKIGCDVSTVRRTATALGLGQQVGGVWVFSAADQKKLAEKIRPGQPGNPEIAKYAANRSGKRREKENEK